MCVCVKKDRSRRARCAFSPLPLPASLLAYLPLPRRPVAGQQEGGDGQDLQELAGPRVLDAVVQLRGGGNNANKGGGRSGENMKVGEGGG